MHAVATALTFGKVQWEEAAGDLLAETRAMIETPTWMTSAFQMNSFIKFSKWIIHETNLSSITSSSVRRPQQLHIVSCKLYHHTVASCQGGYREIIMLFCNKPHKHIEILYLYRSRLSKTQHLLIFVMLTIAVLLYDLKYCDASRDKKSIFSDVVGTA